jgi:hypothetical protein
VWITNAVANPSVVTTPTSLPPGTVNRFTGGTISQITIDVGGEAYVDLEREAALMLMRE